MESVTVSASMGTISPLLGTLTSLTTGGHAKLKERERQELKSLEDELVILFALLRMSAMVKEPDLQVKEWMRQVREVGYDTEDCIDLFLHDHPRRESNFLERLSPAARSRSKRLIEEIRELKSRLVSANDRHKRYMLAVEDKPASDANAAVDVIGSGSVTIDPLLLHMEEAALVAIDGPRDELIQHLMHGQPHLKIVSITGMGGIGKTTLAQQVYTTMMVQTRFDCQAFVYVGRSPSIRTVLMDVLRQVSGQERGGITDEHEAMTQLRKFLAHKRYLIILDDIWSISAWKAINCALPGNDSRSRIITTTRIHDVAISCSNHPDDVIHVMKPLDESDSKRLFHSRIVGSEEVKCREECSEVHDNVLNICGGLPLSIITVASFLARIHAEQGGWKMVNKSSLSALVQYPPLDGMRKLLHISYADLPLQLKSCFLYMSVFPQNCAISKDRLIWRWAAEGFISTLETGRSYFNELINRSLIQPVFGPDDEEGEPIGCTVHGVIHDFVVSLSSEDNFVILDEELNSMTRDVIRRLSLNYAKQEYVPLASNSGSIKNLSQARSLTVFGCVQQMPHLGNFLLLRVLDLEDAERLQNKNIEDIGRLFNLRYLGLGGENVTELPESVGDLQHLRTLEVRRTNVRKLPPTVARLQKLARLLAKVLDDIPDGIEKMQDLQEVSMVSVSSRRLLDLVAELVKLRQLRVLGVKWCFRDELHGDIQAYRNYLVSSLNKVAESRELECLILHADDACSLEFLADSWDPPRLLQRLVLKSLNYYFSGIPISLASCRNLTYLDIAINLDKEEDLSIVAHLPALIILKLSTKEKPIIIRQGFECLKAFWFECRDGGFKLVFEEGAMPQLRKLHLSFKLLPLQPQEGFDFGLRNLPCLKRVHAKINCDGARVSEVEQVEDAIKGDVSMNPSKPTLELSKENCVEEKVTIDEGQKSTVEEVSN